MKRRETIVLAAGIAITVAAATAAGAANLGLLGAPADSRPSPGRLSAGSANVVEQLVASDAASHETTTTLPPEVVIVYVDGPIPTTTAASAPATSEALADEATETEFESSAPDTAIARPSTRTMAPRTRTTVDDKSDEPDDDKGAESTSDKAKTEHEDDDD